jgi:hypothetical protein
MSEVLAVGMATHFILLNKSMNNTSIKSVKLDFRDNNAWFRVYINISVNDDIVYN